MEKNLLLVDFENKQKVDLSLLDDSFRAIIFVGVNQKQPKLENNVNNKNKFRRLDFQKIEGDGKNALDFHIAFELGRVFEISPETNCFILSGDKGFDSLLRYLNKSGLKCKRINSLDELSTKKEEAGTSIPVTNSEGTVCKKCRKISTVEHNGGRWCTNCGSFAIPPDPRITAQLKSRNELERRSLCNPLSSERRYSHASTCLHCGIGIDLGSIFCDACN